MTPKQSFIHSPVFLLIFVIVCIVIGSLLNTYVFKLRRSSINNYFQTSPSASVSPTK